MSLIQPINQGFIATSKSYYLRKTFPQLVKCTNVKGQLPVKDFCRNVNIKTATDNTGKAWAEVRQSSLNGVWLKIWPDVVTDVGGFESEGISSSTCVIVDVVRSVGFEKICKASGEEFLQYHMKELKN
jgi:hypothetical protein